MTIAIRLGHKDDVNDISKIHVSCWNEVYSFMPKEVHSIRNLEYRKQQWTTWFEKRNDEEALFSIVSDGTVVGFALCKRNNDPSIDAAGELHAAYILPPFRGGLVGPTVMSLMSDFLHSKGMWPSCLWAFKQNKHRRFYTATGWRPLVYRDRLIAGIGIPEIGYISPDYDTLSLRLERMRASIAQKQSQPRFQMTCGQAASH